MKCKKCGAENAPGTINCINCNEMLEEAITITMPIWKKCPVCGYTLAEDEKVCRYCQRKKREEEESGDDDNRVLKMMVKTVMLLLILVLLFASAFFGVQMLF